MLKTTSAGSVEVVVHMFDLGDEWVQLTCREDCESVKLQSSSRESRVLDREAALLVMSGLVAASWDRTTTTQKVPSWAL